jgi:hypothetical protein
MTTQYLESGRGDAYFQTNVNQDLKHREFPVMKLALALAALFVAAATFAQPAMAGPPPSNAKPLSEIIKSLEDSGNVTYFDEVEWDDDGYWEVQYYRPDGSKVEIKVDPVSGEPRR